MRTRAKISFIFISVFHDQENIIISLVANTAVFFIPFCKVKWKNVDKCGLVFRLVFCRVSLKWCLFHPSQPRQRIKASKMFVALTFLLILLIWIDNAIRNKLHEKVTKMKLYQRGLNEKETELNLLNIFSVSIFNEFYLFA